jgi:hypothetical protein
MDGPSQKQVRKLFAAWVEQRQDPNALLAGMTASLHFALPEAVRTARRVLAEKSTSPRLCGQAILVIGHHGIKEDVPLLIGFRGDERVTRTATAPGGGQIGAGQVRDVATAMALKLSGQNFEDFGFGSDTFVNHQISSEPAPFRGVTMFRSDEERAACLKKAWTWLDAQPKAEALPPLP